VGLSAVGPTVLPAVLSPSIAVATASETAPGVRLDWPATAPAADPAAEQSAPAAEQSTLAAEPPTPAAGQSDPADEPPTAPAADLDWPALAAGEHVVVRGDCLWDIAEAWLAEQHPGAAVTAPEVARAVHAWWQANTDVLGADPDLLLPGQVLRPPA
jgi:nucleoid-associated protein YgaU